MNNASTTITNKWVVLIFGIITHLFVSGLQNMCMPVLFKEISDEMGLDLVQLGVIWATTPLAGLVVNLLGGILSDRFGVKKNLIFLCLLTGLTGAARGLSSDYLSLFITSLIFNVFNMMIPITVHRTASLWFGVKQRGMAQGLLAFGMALGFSTAALVSATFLSPLLGGWRNVLFVYGAVSTMISLLWLLLKEPSQQESGTSKTPANFIRSFSSVIKIKQLWFLGFVLFGYQACVQGVLGYLSLYLRSAGWAAASADGALAAFSLAGAIGAVPLSFLSDRLGSRKWIITGIVTTTFICAGLLSFISNAIVWILMILMGFGRDAIVAVSTAMNYELDEVKPENSGTALGLQHTIARPGAVISPPIGNSLAGIGASIPFIFWAAFAGISLVLLFFDKKGSAKSHLGSD